jgi:hypothetical protein
MTTAGVDQLAGRIAEAAASMATWLRRLEAWASHPVNATRSVSGHFGPTILSEHDCVLHYARFLAAAGVPWEDMHMELSPGQWMYDTRTGVMPRRIDLAVMRRDRLAAAPLPALPGSFPLDAVFEFALASSYWQHGIGSPKPMLNKIAGDVTKVDEYLRSGLATRGYVVVVEECDHGLPAAYRTDALQASGVEVLLLQQWRSA